MGAVNARSILGDEHRTEKGLCLQLTDNTTVKALYNIPSAKYVRTPVARYNYIFEVPTMNIEIRPARVDDCHDLGHIHVESWKAAYKGVVPDSFLDKMSADRSEDRFIDAISQGSERNIVALVEDKVAGFMCLGKCRDEDVDETYGEIWGIYLHPAFWRQGIGAELLLYGISSLKAEGYNRATLWVLEGNTNARKFYEKFGFLFEGTKKELSLGKNLNEIRYVKNL
jgi:ribosomal protein S18 acetylase RimI-like enzyme